MAELKALIKQKFKTETAFAFAIGWAPSKVSKLLIGMYTPKLSESVVISRALDISLDTLASFFV